MKTLLECVNTSGIHIKTRMISSETQKAPQMPDKYSPEKLEILRYH